MSQALDACWLRQRSNYYFYCYCGVHTAPTQLNAIYTHIHYSNMHQALTAIECAEVRRALNAKYAIAHVIVLQRCP